MTRKKPFWRNIKLPPEYPKRLIQGILAYLAVMLLLGSWVTFKASSTLEELDSRTPQATAFLLENKPTTAEVEPPANLYGKQGTPKATQGYVSIVMTGAGLSSSITEYALRILPQSIALAFSPYSDQLQEYMQQTVSDNRESLLLIPMEPADYPQRDPGPKALLTRLNEEENKKNLQWILGRAQGFSGVMNFMGSRLMGDTKNLTPVLEALSDKKVFLIEHQIKVEPKAATLAKRARVPYLAADLTIDTTATETAVRQQLVQLEKIAEKRGYAIGVAQAYPVSVNVLRDWARYLDTRGIKLIPLSDLFQVAAAHDKKRSKKTP